MDASIALLLLEISSINAIQLQKTFMDRLLFTFLPEIVIFFLLCTKVAQFYYVLCIYYVLLSFK